MPLAVAPSTILPTADCEPIRAGAVAQPVNTATAGGFVLVGAWLWSRATRAASPTLARAYAAAVVSVGIGSAAYHAVGGAGGRWLHDVTLALPFAVIAGGSAASAAAGTPRQAVGAAGIGGVVSGSVLAVAPTWGVPVTAVAAVAAVVGTVVAPGGVGRWRTRAGGATAASLALALPLQLWGRTDGWLCQPYLPAHGLWHVLAALALGAAGCAVVEPLELPGRRPGD